MVSVIVPVYNAGRFVDEAVASVTAQTFTDWELILVDDGSTDDSGRRCDEAAASDSRIRVIHKPNGGLSDARNAGIDEAGGEWIVFLDADDRLDPRALELMTAEAASTRAEVVCADFYASADALAAPADMAKAYSRETVTGREAVRRMLYQSGGPSSSMCGRLYARALWRNLRFRKGTWYEDLDIFYRLMLRSRGVALMPGRLYLYRVHPGSFTQQWSPRRMDVLDVCDRMVDYLGRHYPELAPAARERRMSAAFNMLGLMLAEGVDDEAGKARCRRIIRGQRLRSLLDRHVRMRSRGAALLSYFPPMMRSLLRRRYSAKR